MLFRSRAPLLATTLIPPGQSEPLNDAQTIVDAWGHALAAVIDNGACPMQPTTVVDLTPMGDGDAPQLIRQGAGDAARLGL